MGLVYCFYGLHVRPKILMIRAVKSTESAAKSVEPIGERLQVLKRVDEELRKGNKRVALSLVRDLQGKPGGLNCFGVARQDLRIQFELLQSHLLQLELVFQLQPLYT